MSRIRAPRFSASLAVLGGLCACTEPRFRADLDASSLAEPGLDARVDAAETASVRGDGGSAGDAADHDGGTPGPLPTGLALGHFAARTYTFTVDGWAAARGVGYTHAEIRRDGDDVVIADHYCSFDGAWALFLQVNGSLRYPEDLPPRVVTVHEGSDGWYTRDTPYALGFTFAPPVDCTTPGQTIPAPTTQPWNKATGTCKCPISTADPPSERSDCRVTDPDDDEEPGLTVKVDISGSTSTFRVVQENHDIYVQGRMLSGGRMLAHFASSAQSDVLECVPADPCTFGNPKPCATANNVTEFVPIPDDWTCEDVLANLGSLFATPPPERAPNCVQ